MSLSLSKSLTPAAAQTPKQRLQERAAELGLTFNSKTTGAALATMIEIEENRLNALASAVAVKSGRSERDLIKARKRDARKAAKLRAKMANPQRFPGVGAPRGWAVVGN